MMNSAIRTAVATAALSLAVGTVWAQSVDENISRVRAKVLELYPSTRVDVVKATPILGMYEVVMGQNVAYVEPSGRYFFFGRLWDMQARKDLTAERLAEVDRVDVSTLPLSDAIKVVHGDGRRIIFVFADPNCPHCRTLDKTLATIGDITVYTFLYPVLSDDSTTKARAIWCAPNRIAAWSTWNAQGNAPVSPPCTDPIDRNLALGQSLAIRGTPTMFSADGRRLSGAAPVQEIVAWLDRSTAVATASAPTSKTSTGAR